MRNRMNIHHHNQASERQLSLLQKDEDPPQSSFREALSLWQKDEDPPQSSFRKALSLWQKDEDPPQSSIRNALSLLQKDEDPPQSSFRKAISSLQQAFQYPFRLLSSWREKLQGPASSWTNKITSSTTSKSKTMKPNYQPSAYSLHGSLNDQRLLHQRLLDTCTGLLLPPATKLGQGNIFRSVCQEFCSRGALPHCMLGYTTHTP